MTDADFQNYNYNPNQLCPSLTAGSAVCVQVLNATDAIPPTPTNKAAGSAPSVRVFDLTSPFQGLELCTIGMHEMVYGPKRRYV
jgi:hypothetical protein